MIVLFHPLAREGAFGELDGEAGNWPMTLSPPCNRGYQP